MTSEGAYVALVLVVGAERIAELVVSTRNARWAKERGGVETGLGHYGPMVVLHTGLLVGSVTEVLVRDRRFVPALGWPMLTLAAAAQGLRWWSIASLGRRWNTRVIVVPGLPLVSRGPYRFLDHPNYLAVVVEGVALPLVHGAWGTAVAFSALDLPLLRTRLRTEQRALGRTP